MKLRIDGANRTRVELANGDELFFSYETCVAARVHGTTYKTEKRWSNTTQKHLTQWGVKEAPEKPQEWFDDFALTADNPTQDPQP